MNLKRNLANIVTGLRILCSVWMLVYPVFSLPFYTLYLFCGFTDMIDGTIARSTNSCSSLGSTLDSVADIVFLIAAFVKILPAVHMPQWLTIWIFIIAAIKTAGFAVGFLHRKNMQIFHSLSNKLTGFLVFLVPLTVFCIPLCISISIVCVFATVTAVQELYIIHRFL